MAYRRVGTSYRNLAGSTGGVIDELGSGLLSTDTSGSRAQTLGPQLAQQIAAGIPNSDFALLPQDPDYPIAADNELPFFGYLEGPDLNETFPEPEHLTAYVRSTTDYPAPSGYVLELTAEVDAVEDEKIAFERWIPLPTNYARTVDRRPKIHAYCPAPGASAGDVSFFYSFDYYDVTQQEVLDSKSRTVQLDNLASVNDAGVIGEEIDILGGGASWYTAPSGAYWLRIRFGIEVDATLTTTEQVYVSGLRIDTSDSDLHIIDTVPTADSDSYGQINVQNSELYLVLNRGTRDYDPSGLPTAGIVLSGVESEPNFNSSMRINAAPQGATYDGPETPLTPADPVNPRDEVETELELNSAKLRGAQMPDANTGTANAVTIATDGMYSINLRVTFNYEEGYDGLTLLGARLRLNGSVIGQDWGLIHERSTILLPGGPLLLPTAHISLIRPLAADDELSVGGFIANDDTNDWFATVAELSVMRLGYPW